MVELKSLTLGDMEFNCRLAGDPNNEAVILLHGFPETSMMWSQLMQDLASRGYYCIAPDQRGYSEKACPKGVKHYKIDLLSGDILNLADKLGVDKFHLVGHDWGALIGWYLVYHNPDRILSWSALSVPHSRAFGKALKLDEAQKKKSRYIGLFLIPILPEIRIRKKDFHGFRRLWKHHPPEEVEDYLRVFRRKKSLTAALNYYRANLRKGRRSPVGNIQTPTLFIWGNKDLAVGEFAAKGNDKYIEAEYSFLEVDGGHWLVQTNYGEVKEAVIAHLDKYGRTIAN